MTVPRRIVLDTSTLVGAVLRPGSPPHRALQLALSQAEVCVSIDALMELDRVLGRSKFDLYLDLETRMKFVALLRQKARFVQVTEKDNVAVKGDCRDSTDGPFLALALAAQADAIVSSDLDLLTLNPWRGIDILTPVSFLDVYGPKEAE
jgi:putative PIN family toxin of toxin-antitoxin system